MYSTVPSTQYVHGVVGSARILCLEDYELCVALKRTGGPLEAHACGGFRVHRVLNVPRRGNALEAYTVRRPHGWNVDADRLGQSCMHAGASW